MCCVCCRCVRSRSAGRFWSFAFLPISDKQGPSNATDDLQHFAYNLLITVASTGDMRSMQLAKRSFFVLFAHFVYAIVNLFIFRHLVFAIESNRRTKVLNIYINANTGCVAKAAALLYAKWGCWLEFVEIVTFNFEFYNTLMTIISTFFLPLCWPCVCCNGNETATATIMYG